MQKFNQKFKTTTLYKYFLSYFLILTILSVGYFATFRTQLKDVYTQELNTQAERQLTNICEDLNDAFYTINQIHYLLQYDIDLIISRYMNESWYLYQAAQRFDEYVIANNFIENIGYIHYGKDQILSSGNHIRKTDDGYEIYLGKEYVSLPLEDYANSLSNQLLLLENGNYQMLIYLPTNDGNNTYTIFYILSIPEIKNLFDRQVGLGVSSICMLNEDNQIITGYAPEILEPHLPNLDLVSTPTFEEDNETIHSITGILNGYSLVTVVSNEAILQQANIAFRNVYASLLLLSLIGMMLIILAMRITYWPLHKLTKKLLPSASPHGNYVEQIDTAFTNVYSENQRLQQKIDSYRLSMQKSLLDSIVTDHALVSENNPASIDQLFCMEPNSHIYMIRVQTPKEKKGFPQDVQKLLNTSLPGDTPPSLLFELNDDYAVFLVYYAGSEPNKDEVLQLLLTDLYQETGYQSALSNSAESPLEIPSLYENAATASEFWDRMPVVSYPEIAIQIETSNTLLYPYSHLESLTGAMKTCQITVAREQILELLELLDRASAAGSAFPDFFTRCVLIDILTILVNSMNTLNVKFKSYSDLYFNTLYLCRSCSYIEKKEEIHQNILSLLETYETEYQSSTIQVSKIKEIIEREYTSPDFAISTLADTFHVSIAYMSYLFKKSFEVNFSDYLWNLRMEKAKELLESTDMNIDQISVSVGYLNTSSFRRKFKQETGLTPSQYREQIS